MHAFEHGHANCKIISVRDQMEQLVGGCDLLKSIATLLYDFIFKNTHKKDNFNGRMGCLLLIGGHLCIQSNKDYYNVITMYTSFGKL